MGGTLSLFKPQSQNIWTNGFNAAAETGNTDHNGSNKKKKRKLRLSSTYGRDIYNICLCVW
jgi:hypothetical protein